MFRPLLTMAAVGVAGIVAWKLLWGLLLPLAVGVVAVLLKVAFWGVLFALAIWAFRRLSRASEPA